MFIKFLLDSQLCTFSPYAQDVSRFRVFTTLESIHIPQVRHPTSAAGQAEPAENCVWTGLDSVTILMCFLSCILVDAVSLDLVRVTIVTNPLELVSQLINGYFDDFYHRILTKDLYKEGSSNQNGAFTDSFVTRIANIYRALLYTKHNFKFFTSITLLNPHNNLVRQVPWLTHFTNEEIESGARTD